MRTKLQSVTTLPKAPGDDRRARMIKYTVAMVIRVICIVLMLFVQGWWLLLFAAGAIFLPYFAVIIANANTSPARDDVERPGQRAIGNETSTETL